ncbi:hypothetical protein MNBD_NITROSPINAE02-1543 [hydrothermal vent metagenome]|uniref:DUF4157 domain-containing protein n=1 Tax=hydrothermal vent metagenome TaxID=652676 RepID=A0A3B1BGG6_9ZZZZ
MRKIFLITALGLALAIPAHAQFRELFNNAVGDVWGEAGRVGYREAADWMGKRNKAGIALDETRKKLLRPTFKGLVDRVHVVYGATMLEEIPAPGGSILLGDSLGQTYCGSIYIKGRYKAGDDSQLALLAHEMTHAWQCEDFGGLEKFGFHYFREYYRGGRSYEDNKLEVDAYKFQAKFEKKLLKRKKASTKKPVSTRR